MAPTSVAYCAWQQGMLQPDISGTGDAVGGIWRGAVMQAQSAAEAKIAKARRKVRVRAVACMRPAACYVKVRMCGSTATSGSAWARAGLALVNNVRAAGYLRQRIERITSRRITWARRDVGRSHRFS